MLGFFKPLQCYLALKQVKVLGFTVCFLQISPMSNLQSYYYTCCKAGSHYFEIHIQVFSDNNSLCLWHWRFFAYVNKHGIILYLKVVIHHLPDSFHLSIWISSSAVTIIFSFCRMFSEEKRHCLLSALRFATCSMVSQSSVNWAISC